MKHLFVLVTMIGTLFSELYAQDKLSNEEIAMTKGLMQKNPKCINHIRWFENQATLSQYLSTISGRCPDEVEWILNATEEWHDANSMIIRLEKQLYPKPGSKKSEKSLAAHFANVDQAKETFRCALEAEDMYERFKAEAKGFVEARRNATYTPPKGELTYYHFRESGGMRRMPPFDITLEKTKDGTYKATLSTEDFDVFDTIAITPEQVNDIRELLIDGEVYKMPIYYDEPYLLLDAPSSSVAVKFSDASYHCNNYPPSKWGGKNISAVNEYLKKLQPVHEKKVEY